MEKEKTRLPSESELIKLLTPFHPINDSNEIDAFIVINRTFPDEFQYEQFYEITNKTSDINNVAKELMAIRHDNKCTKGANAPNPIAEKKSPPIRLFPSIRIRSRLPGILSSQIRELYQTKKELTKRLDMEIQSLVSQDASLIDCEEFASGLIKKAPKKFRVKPDELKQIVRIIYESYFLSFEIKIAPEDWNIFVAAYWKPMNNTFMAQLKDSLDICIAAKRSEQEEKMKARGPNRKRIDYINHIRDEARRLYAIIKFISNLSPAQWPDSFNQLIEKHKSYRKYFEKKGKINSELFTAFLLSQNHKQNMVKNNIYRFFDITIARFNLKDFRRYLDDKECKKWGNSIRYQFFNAVNKGNAQYLTKSGQKYPLVYTDRLAQRDDMKPCDQEGNIIKVSPCIEKGHKILDNYLLDKNVTLVLPKPAN